MDSCDKANDPTWSERWTNPISVFILTDFLPSSTAASKWCATGTNDKDRQSVCSVFTSIYRSSWFWSCGERCGTAKKSDSSSIFFSTKNILNLIWAIIYIYIIYRVGKTQPKLLDLDLCLKKIFLILMKKMFYLQWYIMQKINREDWH